MIEQLDMFVMQNIVILSIFSCMVGLVIFVSSFFDESYEKDAECSNFFDESYEKDAECSNFCLCAFLGIITSVVMLFVVFLLDIQDTVFICMCFAIHIVSILCCAKENIRNGMILSGSLLLMCSYIFTVGYFELYEIPLLIPTCTIGLTYVLIKISMKFWIVKETNKNTKKFSDEEYKYGLNKDNKPYHYYHPKIEGELSTYNLTVRTEYGNLDKGQPKKCVSIVEAIIAFKSLMGDSTYQDMMEKYKYVRSHTEEYCDVEYFQHTGVSDKGIIYQLQLKDTERNNYIRQMNMENKKLKYYWSSDL